MEDEKEAILIPTVLLGPNYLSVCDCPSRDEKNSSLRFGISYWLWGNETVQDMITSHFKITE